MFSAYLSRECKHPPLGKEDKLKQSYAGDLEGTRPPSPQKCPQSQRKWAPAPPSRKVCRGPVTDHKSHWTLVRLPPSLKDRTVFQTCSQPRSHTARLALEVAGSRAKGVGCRLPGGLQTQVPRASREGAATLHPQAFTIFCIGNEPGQVSEPGWRAEDDDTPAGGVGGQGQQPSVSAQVPWRPHLHSRSLWAAFKPYQPHRPAPQV